MTEQTETNTVTAEVKTLPAFRENGSVVEATAKALVSRGMKINGNLATLNDISALSRIGFFQTLGVAEKPQGQRGPNSSVFAVPLNVPGMVVELNA